MNSDKQIQNINVDLIIPNRFQPRLTFDENALNELATSIKEHGIIQPLVLRKINDKYEIIAGERRYKAAQIAGLTEVPAIITDIDDDKSAEVALVENVQRKNLNSMEEAKSYKKILDKGKMTQEVLAQKMGISQSTLANKLRLLNLTPEVQDSLMNGKISERHARSLLMVNDPMRQISLLNRIIAERLTVRQLDAIIKENTSTVIQEPLIKENIIKEEPVMEQNNTPLVNLENQSINENTDNIFDVIDSNNNAENKAEGNQNIPSVENNDNSTQSAVSLIDSIDTLDTLDLDESEVPKLDNNKVPSALENILDKISGPKYASLEDETVNMTLDPDDSFNPFNNLNEAESLPIKAEEIEVLDSLDEEEKEDDTPKVVVEENIIKSGDLSSVKRAYNNLKKEIEAAGFAISSEEFDFEDIYQLIIKVDKQA